MGRIEGKVAIITGAGGGFGRESALLFTQEGAKVIIADMNPEAGKKVEAEVRTQGGDATFVQVDITEPDQVENLIYKTIEIYGKLDILFNNAGFQARCDDIAHMPVELFDTFMKVNVRGKDEGLHRKYCLYRGILRQLWWNGLWRIQGGGHFYDLFFGQ